MSEIIAVEGKISGERKARVFFRRKVIHELMGDMPGPHQDAMVEIAIAKRLIDNPGFFRTMSYGRVSGMSADELSNWQIDVNKRYGEWRRQLYGYSPIALSICTRVCQDEDSIDQIRNDEHIDWGTAYKLLHYGLNEYSIISGWGDQIKK